MAGSALHRRDRFARRCCGAVICMTYLFAVPVYAQIQAQPQTKSPPAATPQIQLAPPETGAASGGASAPQEAAPPVSSPGLLEAIGDLIKDSAQGAQKSIESLNERVGEANRSNVKAAKDAVDGLPRLPGTRVATGRVVCAVSANGAPDCKAGSDKLCHDKGFGDGSSLATETAQTCPARVYLSGRAPKAGDCRMDTYVTQAICQ